MVSFGAWLICSECRMIRCIFEIVQRIIDFFFGNDIIVNKDFINVKVFPITVL